MSLIHEVIYTSNLILSVLYQYDTDIEHIHILLMGGSSLHLRRA